MSVVFVHGNPDTPVVWDAVRDEFADEETLALAVPGFGGTPLPNNFDCSRWDYAGWLERELRRFDEPPHLVAHDIGSVFAHGVLKSAPELVRSWALTGVCDPDFGWHGPARIWQTRRLGEELRDRFLGLSPDERTVQLVEAGIPAAWAPTVVDSLDGPTYDVILSYYRSVAYFGDWTLEPAEDLPPGMFIWGLDDPFQETRWGIKAASRLGVQFVGLACGHWWQIERPREGARILRHYWEQVEAELIAADRG